MAYLTSCLNSFRVAACDTGARHLCVRRREILSPCTPAVLDNLQAPDSATQPADGNAENHGAEWDAAQPADGNAETNEAEWEIVD